MARLDTTLVCSAITPMSHDAPPRHDQHDARDTPSNLTTEKGTAPLSTDVSPAVQAEPSVPVPVVTGGSDEGIRRILPNYVVPTCFARRPPSGNTYPPFQPMHLTSIGQYLSRGFPQRQPPSNVDPHPFVSHDVTEEDWLMFLRDLLSVGELTASEDMCTGPVLCCCCLGLLGLGFALYFRKKFKKEKTIFVCAMIDIWNEKFFYPRKMEVLVARGRQRLSGPPGDRDVPVPGLLCIPGPRKRNARSSWPDGEANDGNGGKEHGDEIAKSADTLPSLKEITAEDKIYRLFVVAL